MTWFRRCRTFTVVFLVSVSAVVASSLVGCSLIVPEPPHTVSAAADSASTSLEAEPGVESVSVEITLRDYRGEGSWSEPEAWVTHLTVRAVPGARGLESTADEVVAQLSRARSAVSMDAVVEAPRIDDGVDADIHFGGTVRDEGLAAERVSAARVLAAVDGVSRVTIGLNDEYPRVEATSLEDWPEVAGGIRADPGFGVGPLASVALVAPIASGDSWSGDGSDGLYLELGMVSPTVALMEELVSLTTEFSVRSIALYSGESVSDDGVFSAIRSSLMVSVESRDDAANLAEHFAELDDPKLWASGTGRACYSIDPREEGDGIESDVIIGCIGLPVGSAEPHNLPVDSGDVAHSILFSS